MKPNGRRADAEVAPRYRRASLGTPRRTLKRTQRERLIDAMIELCAQRGYHAIAITELCSYAGVSPVTFYDQFGRKEECLLAAYRACGERMFARMRQLAAESPDWSETARKVLGELLSNLERDPDAGRLLFIEALGGGAAIRAERQRVLVEFERGAQEASAKTTAHGTRLDIPLMAVIGALRHIISRRLQTHTEDQLPSLLEDGLSWLGCYAMDSGLKSWSTSPGALLDLGPDSSPSAAWAPEPLPPGTHGLPPSVIARSQRTRLIFATAEAMMAKGYQETQIKDIVAAARVARPIFYKHFNDKEHAFLEAQQYPTQYILDRCVQAYFSVDGWPARVWRCFETLLELIASYPAISHLRLVECYAAGPEAIRRAEDITRSFTLFLEEGYRYREQSSALPRLSSEAIAGAFFEIVQRQVVEGKTSALRAYLPQLTYIALAPFTGRQEAIALVEEMKEDKPVEQRA